MAELRGYRLRPVKAMLGTSRTHAAISSPLGSLRIAANNAMRLGAEAKRGVDRESLRSKRPYCSWGPCEPSSSAGLCGARHSAHQELTSRRLFERSEHSERSEFGAAAKTEQRRAVGPRPTGEWGALLFGDFLLGKQEKVTALSGAHPDAASRSRTTSTTSSTSGSRLPPG